MAALLMALAATPACEVRIEKLPEAIRAEMTGNSWKPECPASLDDLRLLHVPYVGFDDALHEGELVVHAQLAQDFADIFCELFVARFPIERMTRIDAYQGSDDASMADNNTSAFNCRFVQGTTTFSKHSWGAAVDINPRINPWVTKQGVFPPTGATFVDRSKVHKGLIVDKELVHAAFLKRGFTWGGSWSASKDYQHFEKRLKTDKHR